MRIGLFGGTFDPVHEGHLAVARCCRGQARLDQVWFVPSGRPPHKTGSAPAAYRHRLRMVELATAGDDSLVASTLEDPGLYPGPHYSVHTVARARAQLGAEGELMFVIGEDAFEEITLWYDWESLVEAVEFLVVSRPSTTEIGHMPPPGTRYRRLRLDHPASSSEIRRRLRGGERAIPWLPGEVASYIAGHGLYQAGSQIRVGE